MFGATDGVTLGFAVGVFVGELVGVALGFGRTDSASINRSTEYPLFAISIIPYKTGYLFFPCIQVKYLLPAAFCAVTKLFNAVRSETVYAYDDVFSLIADTVSSPSLCAADTANTSSFDPFPSLPYNGICIPEAS